MLDKILAAMSATLESASKLGDLLAQLPLNTLNQDHWDTIEITAQSLANDLRVRNGKFPSIHCGHAPALIVATCIQSSNKLHSGGPSFHKHSLPCSREPQTPQQYPNKERRALCLNSFVWRPTFAWTMARYFHVNLRLVG